MAIGSAEVHPGSHNCTCEISELLLYVPEIKQRFLELALLKPDQHCDKAAGNGGTIEFPCHNIPTLIYSPHAEKEKKEKSIFGGRCKS